MTTKTPNVLLITADSWRADSLSAVGHPCVKTPSVDRLAADAVLFRNHFVQAAPCGPSRASLFTGLYLHNHRSVRNGTPLDSRHTNLALEMRKAGYDPSLVGYTDTSADPRLYPPGHPALTTYEGLLPGFRPELVLVMPYTPWLDHLASKGYDVPRTGLAIYRPVSNYPGAETRGPTYPPPCYRAEDSETAFATDRAMAYLAEHGDRPWFLHLSYLRPHSPFVVPEPYNRMYDLEGVPAPRRAPSPEEEARQHPFLAYRLERIRKAAEMSESDLKDLDPWIAVGVGQSRITAKTNKRDLMQLKATYYGMVSEVDHQIGRLIARLREVGQYDDTLIVFTSDHGTQLGDHWLLGAESYFDASYHVPLIIRVPGVEKELRGRVVDAFTEGIDLMPTILDLVGAEIPVPCDGASLRPFLFGETPSRWRREVHWECDFRDVVDAAPEKALGIGFDECAFSVIRDERYKYVHFAALPPVFFDLHEDPDELQNLADDPAHGGLVLRYAQKMLSWRMRHDERALTGIHLGPGGPVERPRAARGPIP